MPETGDGARSESRGRIIRISHLEGHPLGAFVEVRMLRVVQDITLRNIHIVDDSGPEAQLLRTLSDPQAGRKRYFVPAYEVSVPMNRTSDIIKAIAEGSLRAEDMLRASRVGALAVVIGDAVNLYERKTAERPQYFTFQVISGHEITDRRFRPSPSMKVLIETPSVVHRLNLNSARPWDLIAETMASRELTDAEGDCIDSPEKLMGVAGTIEMTVDYGKLHNGLDRLSSMDYIDGLIKAGKLNASELSEHYAHIAELQRQNVRQNMIEIQKKRRRGGDLFAADRDISLNAPPLSRELQDVPLGYLISLTDAFVESLRDKGRDIEEGFTYEDHSLRWQGNLFLGFIYSQILRALDRADSGQLGTLDRADLQHVVSPIQRQLGTLDALSDAQLKQIERTQGYFGAQQGEVAAVIQRIKAAVARKEPLGIAAHIVLTQVHRRLLDMAELIGYYLHTPHVLDRRQPMRPKQEPDSGGPTLAALEDEIRTYGGNPKSLGIKRRSHDPRVF